jgi:hypothetical protein
MAFKIEPPSPLNKKNKLTRQDKKQARAEINSLGGKKDPRYKPFKVTTANCTECSGHTSMYTKGAASKLPNFVLNGAAKVKMMDPRPRHGDEAGIQWAIPGVIATWKAKTQKRGSSKRQDVKKVATLNNKIKNLKPNNPVEYTAGSGSSTAFVYSDRQAKQLNNYTQKKSTILSRYK